MALHRRTALLNPKVRVTDAAGGFIEEGEGACSEHPSMNDNRASFVGCGRGITRNEFRGVVKHFQTRDIPRWFFWLSPCSDEGDIRGWLAEAGFPRFGGTGYPTLVRTCGKLPEHETNLEIRNAGEDDLVQHSRRLEELYGDSLHIYTSTFRDDGYHHYLAFDGEEPVAGALMGAHEGLTGLGMMATLESHRRRGGQGALITRRVNDACELGCDLMVSETLTMLTTSLGNLRKKGFEIAYEKEVYVGGSAPIPDYRE
jgi:GNAT superfamily N-acetyltransferase